MTSVIGEYTSPPLRLRSLSRFFCSFLVSVGDSSLAGDTLDQSFGVSGTSPMINPRFEDSSRSATDSAHGALYAYSLEPGWESRFRNAGSSITRSGLKPVSCKPAATAAVKPKSSSKEPGICEDCSKAGLGPTLGGLSLLVAWGRYCLPVSRGGLSLLVFSGRLSLLASRGGLSRLESCGRVSLLVSRGGLSRLDSAREFSGDPIGLATAVPTPAPIIPAAIAAHSPGDFGSDSGSDLDSEYLGFSGVSGDESEINSSFGSVGLSTSKCLVSFGPQVTAFETVDWVGDGTETSDERTRSTLGPITIGGSGSGSERLLSFERSSDRLELSVFLFPFPFLTAVANCFSGDGVEVGVGRTRFKRGRLNPASAFFVINGPFKSASSTLYRLLGML
ncbi:hypothetical protein OCU04_000351 [Sclerotinia nivalis]|uniref:Uncharacterized protein n=1 Tax=Sclerotinia nivalis TaxID=352851 RepID=A0A9X0DPN4_9HELO|nr:hypothetical protein OCU04_000351 [Sclerotinia nivalis]